MTHHIFAYGSNMNITDLVRWAHEKGRPLPVISARYQAEFPGVERCWNYWSNARQGGAANLRPRLDSSVWGLVLEVDADTLHTIDLKEGHPIRYSRGMTQQGCWRPDTGQWVDAWVYIVTPKFEVHEAVRPTREYLKLIIDAAVDHQLPMSEIEKLRLTPVVCA